jgi:ABC-type transport system substrate-binding protein
MNASTRRRQFRWSSAAGILAATALFGASLVSGGRVQDEVPQSGGTLRVRGLAESGKPDLDPASGRWVFVTEQIYDGLVWLNEKLQPMPRLAQYWTISKDGRTYVFDLRPGVKFHNGDALTSEDVKFSLERLLRRETNSPVRDYFLARISGAREFVDGKAGGVSGLRCPNASTFEIQWLNPEVSALTLLSLSFCKILPSKAVLAGGASFFYKPSGTGAFKFDSYVLSPKGELMGVRMERNPDYYGRKAYLDAIEFSPYYTVEHFLNREIDIIPFVSDRLALGNNPVLDAGPGPVSYLLMSCANPPLDRQLVRKALALSINKEKLAAAVPDLAFVQRPTNNFIPPRWPDFYPLDDPALFDRAKGRQMLEDMSYFFDKPFPRLLVLLPVSMRESGAGNRFFDELASQLGKIEVPLSLRYYQSLREVKDYRQPFLALAEWAPDFPDPESVLRPLFHSRSEINLANGRYANPRVDALLEEAVKETSLNRRNELFRRIELILGEDLPAVPLYSNDPRIVVQSVVRGIKVPLMGFAYLDARDVWLARKEPPQ